MNEHNEMMGSVTQDQHMAIARLLLEQEIRLTSKLAIDLHDNLGQTLSAARLALESQIKVQPTEGAHQANTLLGEAIKQVRNMLISIRPVIVFESGLLAALSSEVTRLQHVSPKVEVFLEAEAFNTEKRWPSEVEYALFMIAREAMRNALQHADAKHITVILRATGDRVQIDVVDDGSGFNVQSKPVREGHLGLIGMRERSIAIGAQFNVSSIHPTGTRVQVVWESSKSDE